MKNFIEELKWRGMLHDMIPETEKLLSEGMVKGYIGFDPTADSLGVGNLVQVMTLLHFQQAGHKPIALVGGATGMVGDPSFKAQERSLLSPELLQHNLNGQLKQLQKFLDFDCGANSAEIVNNYDWFKDFTFLDFIREVGKHISVNYMMSKDSVKSRLERGDEGMSFTEFTYQLIQGYDFYYLWKNQGVVLQMGGSDQWGNIVTGTELVRRKGGGKAYALTTQLIKKADGTKFGKTESGNVWLDPAKTSPYQFYQFWLNASDDDAGRYIRIFTLFDRAKIESLEAEHATAPHLRVLQKALAEDITVRVHSRDEFEAVLKVSEILFGKSDKETLLNLNEAALASIAAEIPSATVSAHDIQNGVNISDLLAEKTNLLASKSEVRRAVQGNAISVNKDKITDANAIVSAAHLIQGRYIMVENGKKNKYMLIVEN